MSRTRILALVSIAAALTAAGCNGSSPTAPGGGSSGPLHLGPFAVGQSAAFTFGSAGTFGYHCIPHRSMGMTGTVQVDASGADSALVQIAASGFTYTPSTAHIKPGGTARWVNASSSNVHTVTSD